MPNHRILRFVFLVLSAIPMLWSVQAVAAQKVNESSDPLSNFAFSCPGKFILTQATGMPADEEHHFTLTGSCTLQANYLLTGRQVIAKPSVVVTSLWNSHDHEYTEKVTIKDGRKLTLPFYSVFKNGEQITIHLDGDRQAMYQCSVNPLINAHPQCKQVANWGDDTDWIHDLSGIYDMPPLSSSPHDTLWGSAAAQPMVVGQTTAMELKAMYGSNQATASRCDNLHLASHASNGKTKTYTFTGTCQLYHTKDGSGGLKPTKVKVTATWNPDTQMGLEVVQVLTSLAKGGGSWGWKHKCYYNPWLTPWNKSFCILNFRSDNNPPPAVYKPITDIMRIPLASDLASHLIVAKSGPNMKLSKQPQPLRLRQGITRRPATSSGHINSKLMAGNTPGQHTASAKPGSMQARPAMNIPAPKVQIVHETYRVDTACKDLHKLITFDVTARNDGGPLAMHQWSLYVTEGGGAGLSSAVVWVPPLVSQAQAHVSIPVLVSKSHIAQLPGTHWLKLISLDNPTGHKTTTALRPITLPQGICQPKLRVSSPSQMHMHTGATLQSGPMAPMHRMSLPAVQ